eukprot:TRINITY_DN1574_c0_g1_i10.p1 TRINITY_DN1574_c0_g1~~TRINITY_DN1574_c0_g1_i10.p1  ORF type:complete len:318 (-),score=68.27 TRINITY_DN1574_c0_g1_i10:245-1198(-)
MVIHKIALTKRQIADICQSCERYVGTMGGGMDQAISFLAEEGKASLISFNPLKAVSVPLPEEAIFFVAHSLVESSKCETADMCFNKRVIECRLAAKVLAKKLQISCEVHRLLDIQKTTGMTLKELKGVVDKYLSIGEGGGEAWTRHHIASQLGLSEPELSSPSLIGSNPSNCFFLKQRAYHVFHESSLVEEFAQASTPEEMGRIMTASHVSCHVNYDCSCEELNRLVDLCMQAGAFGSRLTGAGWGGCTISLVPKEKSKEFFEFVRKSYYEEKKHLFGNFSLEDFFFHTSPGSGAFIVDLNLMSNETSSPDTKPSPK